MRICSLLPGATEIAFALGLGDDVVGVTHECDYPAEARQKPVVVRSLIDSHRMTSLEIDRWVERKAAQQQKSLRDRRRAPARSRAGCHLDPGTVRRLRH